MDGSGEGDRVEARRALILSGGLGSGHDVVSDVVAGSLVEWGWRVRTLDCMALLGSLGARIGDYVFRRITAQPGLYDALHFAHFRQGGRLVQAMDHQATTRLVPAVRQELQREPAELLIGTFATGASVAAKLRPLIPNHRSIVLCTDVDVYWLWVWPEIDLYLVTSTAAAGSVRRYAPQAEIALVPPPVRPAFYEAPDQGTARKALGIPSDAPCALLMGGGWGLGPIEALARALGSQDIHVLAVAGRNATLQSRLEQTGLAHVHPFGYTDRIPQLMAASDVVITAPGATTCSEARVVGRHLIVLDVFPGHGRENLQHELSLGDADTCAAAVEEAVPVVEAVLRRLERPLPRSGRSTLEWPTAFGQALARIGMAEPRANHADKDARVSSETGP